MNGLCGEFVWERKDGKGGRASARLVLLVLVFFFLPHPPSSFLPLLLPCSVVSFGLLSPVRLRLKRRPQGTFDAFRRIPKEEGFAGFFRGLGPSVSRAAVINGCGIASYDHSKQLTKRLTGAEEGLTARVTGALISGLVSALVSSPFDVVKSRLMNQPAGSTLYSGMVDCAMKTARAEGVMALYKGFTPAYARLAPWQLVFFLSFEQLNLWMFGKTL